MSLDGGLKQCKFLAAQGTALPRPYVDRRAVAADRHLPPGKDLVDQLRSLSQVHYLGPPPDNTPFCRFVEQLPLFSFKSFVLPKSGKLARQFRCQ